MHDDTALHDQTADGPELDGEELDGEELDGEELDGEELDGEELDGEELDGEELDGEELDGEELDGEELDGEELDGEELDGEELDGEELEDEAPASGRRSLPPRIKPAGDHGGLRTLTIDATKAVAPHRIRSLAKALVIGEGEQIRIEVIGRASGPRFDKAIAAASRAIRYFKGEPVV